MSNFYEKIALDSEKSPENSGFWTTKARFARAGVQEYSRFECLDWPGIDKVAGPVVRVLRPEVVVFDADAMKSFENVPITIEHEAGLVTPGNAREVIVGAAGYPVTREGDQLVVPVTIYDSAAITDAKTGARRELSAGSLIDAEYAPGVDEKFGAFDYVMKSWRGNHITLTKAGKAGPDFYVGDRMTDKKDDVVVEKFVTRSFDSVNYSFTEQTAQIFDRVLGERDAARAELVTAKAAIIDEAEIERRASDRAGVIEGAKLIAKDAKCEGKKTPEIVAEAVAVAFKDVPLEGKSADYVRALFDSAVLSAKKAPAEAVKDRALVTTDSKTDVSGLAAARAEFISKNSGRR